MISAIELPPGIVYKQADKFNGLPIARFVAKANLAALEISPNNNSILAWDSSAIWLEYHSLPVAIIVYSLQDYNKICWISLSYTEPVHRCKKYFKVLYAKLLIIAKEKGMFAISGGIDINNTRMQTAARSVGRSADYVVYTQEL